MSNFRSFGILAGILLTTFSFAQWLNEENYDNYPLPAFNSASPTGFHLRGDSLLVFTNIRRGGIFDNTRPAYLGHYSSNSGHLIDAGLLPVTDSSWSYNRDSWHPTSIGTLNQKYRGQWGADTAELELYNYTLIKHSGFPELTMRHHIDIGTGVIVFDDSSAYYINSNGSLNHLFAIKSINEAIENLHADTNHRVLFETRLAGYHAGKIYMSYAVSRSLTSVDRLDTTYVAEVDLQGSVLNISLYTQGGLITANQAGIYVLNWSLDTAGVKFQVLTGSSLDSLTLAFSIPQPHIEWLYRTSSFRSNLIINSFNDYTSVVIYELYIDTVSSLNNWQRTRAIMYDPSGNERYNFVVKGNIIKGGNCPSLAILDTMLSCYVLMVNIESTMLFLAKIGRDGSLTEFENVPPNLADVEVYPNPTRGGLHIEVPDRLASYLFRLINSQGKIVAEQDLAGKEVYELDLNVTPGIYQCVLQSPHGGFIWFRKLMVK